MAKIHQIVQKIVRRRGCRTEMVILLNDVQLSGMVVKSMSKGVETWKTIFGTGKKKVVLDHFDPQWLAKKNGKNIKMDDSHPSMAQAVAYRTKPVLKEAA